MGLKGLVLLITFLLLSISIPSSAIVVEWNRTYGDVLSGIADVKVVDDGFILAGFTGEVYDSDAWIIRTDAVGNEIWNATFGDREIDVASSIQKVSDGFIIAGLYGGAFGDAWLIKIDFSGSLEWSRYYGTREHERFWWVEVVEDGFIVAGSRSFQGNEDAWLVKTDFEGNVLWNRTYGGKGDDAALCVREVEDGLIIAGFTESFGSGKKDGWLLKVDFEGNEVWNATFGGRLDDEIKDVEPTPDGFILAGYTESFGSGKRDAWVIKVDKTGREVWNVTLGGEKDDEVSAVLPASDGYIIAGFTESFGADRDSWLVKVDNKGNELWNATFGGEGKESFSSIAKTSDGYVLAGSHDGKGWLVKVAEEKPKSTEETKSTPGFELMQVVLAFAAFAAVAGALGYMRRRS